MLRIGIDAHNLEGNRTGVGRYLENILRIWANDEELARVARILLYFKGSVPADDFLRNPLFVCKSLQKLPRPSFFLYFLFFLPWQAWCDKINIMFFPGYMVAPLWWGKSVLVLHDLSFERFPRLVPLRYRIPYQLFGRWGARVSKAIITVSEFSRREICTLYDMPAEKVHAIPLGIDLRIRRASDEEIARAKSAYHISEDYFLSIGQIFNRRHVKESLIAFANIANDFPHLQLLVVGTNRTNPFIPIEEIVRAINATLGREAIVRTQYVSEEDLPALYSGAKATLYLSHYEGFGLPPLESLACGTPAISTAKTSLGEMLGGMQIVVEDPSSVQEIVRQLKAVLQEPSLTERARKEGPIYAQKFSWQQCAHRIQEILISLAKS